MPETANIKSTNVARLERGLGGGPAGGRGGELEMTVPCCTIYCPNRLGINISKSVFAHCLSLFAFAPLFRSSFSGLPHAGWRFRCSCPVPGMYFTFYRHSINTRAKLEDQQHEVRNYGTSLTLPKDYRLMRTLTHTHIQNAPNNLSPSEWVNRKMADATGHDPDGGIPRARTMS